MWMLIDDVLWRQFAQFPGILPAELICFCYHPIEHAADFLASIFEGMNLDGSQISAVFCH